MGTGTKEFLECCEHRNRTPSRTGVILECFEHLAGYVRYIDIQYYYYFVFLIFSGVFSFRYHGFKQSASSGGASTPAGRSSSGPS